MDFNIDFTLDIRRFFQRCYNDFKISGVTLDTLRISATAQPVAAVEDCTCNIWQVQRKTPADAPEKA